jgi:predicted FMN-binding regulatory protein PaiB
MHTADANATALPLNAHSGPSNPIGAGSVLPTDLVFHQQSQILEIWVFLVRNLGLVKLSTNLLQPRRANVAEALVDKPQKASLQGKVSSLQEGTSKRWHF